MRVAIVGGGGGVGASLAFNLALAGRPDDVVLVDRRPEMVSSHVLDLEQVLELSPGCTVRGGGADDAADADVVVLTASTPLALGTSRLEYLEGNAAIADELADALPRTWGGVLVVVTNPVDPLVTRLWRRTGLDRLRVLGYTLNDSLRLRTGLGRALGVAAGAVDAWVLGEHGDASVPVFSRVRVGDEPVEPTAEQRVAADRFLRTWYAKHVALDSGRSSTWTSGLGVARLVGALGAGRGELWPASVVLAGEYGIDGVAVTVPVTLARGGARRVHEWELAPAELDALAAAAETVRAAADSLA